MITWVSNSSWDMLLSKFIYAVKIIQCPRTKICNECEHSNTSGDILNAGYNVDDKEMFGFYEYYFKIGPTNIDEYTKIKLLNLQQDHMIPQRNKEINNKIPDEKNRIIKLMTKT